eukprot:jgi/Psemu1/13997/gm1.13997_g
MGIAPFQHVHHGLDYSTLNSKPAPAPWTRSNALDLWSRTRSSSTNATTTQRQRNNNPMLICSSQEVYIESLGLPYYALAAWVHLCLKTMIPVPTDPRPPYKNVEFDPTRGGNGVFTASELCAVAATLLAPASELHHALRCSNLGDCCIHGI